MIIRDIRKNKANGTLFILIPKRFVELNEGDFVKITKLEE